MDSRIKTITSAANPTVKRLCSLAVKKYRQEQGVFLVEGIRHVQDALRGNFVPDTIVFSMRAIGDPQVRQAVAACLDAGASGLESSDDILSRITGRDNSQPVIGVFRQRWQELADIRGGLWIGLESVRDPGNLGTIVRTVDAAGADGIILIGDTCDPWAPEAVRATMGSFARVKIARAETPAFLAWRKGWTGRVTGTSLHAAAVDYRSVKYTLPLLLLMGGEQAGLSPGISAACDMLVRIPMAGGAESLNLSVSTGIMLYEVLREKL